MDDGPKVYEITVKVTAFVTYGVEAYCQEEAAEVVTEDIAKDTPVGWDVTAVDFVEFDDDSGDSLERGDFDD